jgi:magnesium-transporting ATPase (P-type)
MVQIGWRTNGGDNMTFWILLAIAGFLTFISLKFYNLLFSFVACLAWIGIWAYNLSYPPTNITAGTFVHEVLTYVFIILAITVMLLYFRTRSKNLSNSRNGIDIETITADKNSNRPISKGMMDMSAEEYRDNFRRAIRPNGRKR